QGEELERRGEHELARMQHERIVFVVLFHQRGQLVLAQLRIDVGVPAVVEHAEETVEPHIDTRRLHHRRIERVHSESPGLERLTKLTVTQQHHPTLAGPYAASSGGGLGPYPHVPRIGGVVPHRLAKQLGVAAPSELPESLLYPCRAGQTLPH